MALLSESDREAVKEHLAAVAHDVTLLLFTQTIGGPETALMAKQIVDELAGLNERVTVEEANFVLERERAAGYGIDKIPAIVVLRDGADTRMRFFGAPSGYEFMSLLDAVSLAGGDESGLTDESRTALAGIAQPMTLDVFVTPTWPHCPRAVSLANRIAFESPHVTASCVEATEFMDLTRRYRVSGVPKTIVNAGEREILGAVPEAEFVRNVIG